MKLATLLFMEAKLVYRHRPVTEADVGFIQQLMAAHPTSSRRQLSKLLCQAWNWRQPNGALRDMVCRGLMLKLHREGLIQLPALKMKPRNPLVERNRPTFVAVDAHPLTARLSEIQPLEFRQVRRTPEEALFNSLIEQYHYQHHVQPVGENLKFLVWAQGRPIACLAWSSSPRHLASRDRFIGWSPEARRQNIHFLAYNLRFLILPWVTVAHAASHILSGMARRLSAEWQQMYGHPLYFLETFIDPARFRGTCYRAANWRVLGSTTGRGKDDVYHHGPNRSIKEVLGYPLCRDFRQRLAQIGD
ncbi:MAG: DUF4338 domain-containing protein [Terriglobales bacterium]